MRTLMIPMMALFVGIPAAAVGQPAATPAPAATEKPKAPATAGGPALVAEGERLFARTGCAACHSVDGARRVGPTVKGVFGSPRRLVGGQQVPGDDAYLRAALLDPMGQIVDGYPPSMPSYAGQLQPAQVDALVAYMKTLGVAPAAQGAGPAAGK